MKTIWLRSAVLVFSGTITASAGVSLLTGCGSAGESQDGASASDEALTGPVLPAHRAQIEAHRAQLTATVASGDATSADATGDPSVDSAPTNGECGPGKKICQFANDKNICVDRCVIDTALCAPPTCVVCDPDGKPPQPGCQWDSQECVWLCL